MKLEKAKLVTIVMDEAIQPRVLEDLHAVKVKGFTVSEATGEGLHGAHLSSWEGKNIRIETLVSAEKAQRLIELCADKYLDKFGMIIFASEVEVYRSGRFI